MVDIYEKKRKNLYDKDKRKGREDMKRKKVITVLLCITLLGTSGFTGYRIIITFVIGLSFQNFSLETIQPSPPDGKNPQRWFLSKRSEPL